MYYDIEFKGEQLFDLPTYGSVPLRGSYKVTGVEQPVREVAIKESIFDAHPLSAPVGGVFGVTYLDGTAREIYVPLNDKFNPDYANAVFLRPGRTTNKLDDVWDHEIPRGEEAIPDRVIAAVRSYQEKREQIAAARLQNG